MYSIYLSKSYVSCVFKNDSLIIFMQNKTILCNLFKDAPDSPKDDGVPPLVAPNMSSVNAMETSDVGGTETRSRHLLYTTHFPLPQVT